jgi:hypothetical protein
MGAERQEAASFTIDGRETHVVVRQHAIVASRFEADEMLSALSTALEQGNLAKAVLDQRGLPESDETLREALWDWARGAGRRVALAIILDNEIARMQSNMNALASGLQLRAFGAEPLAEAWLFATPAQRPTAELPPVE